MRKSAEQEGHGEAVRHGHEAHVEAEARLRAHLVGLHARDHLAVPHEAQDLARDPDVGEADEDVVHVHHFFSVHLACVSEGGSE